LLVEIYKGKWLFKPTFKTKCVLDAGDIILYSPEDLILICKLLLCVSSDLILICKVLLYVSSDLRQSCDHCAQIGLLRSIYNAV